MKRLLLVGVLAIGCVAPIAFDAPVEARPRRNVIVIVTDDQSKTLLNRKAMPFLARRAGRARGWVRLTRGFVNTPLCCPARAAILSGRYGHNSGVIDNKAGAKLNERKTIAAKLDAAGYRTALMGKYLNGYPFGRGQYVPRGWDRWYAFKHTGGAYFDYELNENGTLVHYGSAPRDYSTDVLASKAVRFIRRSRQPFFLYWAPKAPHGPAIPAPRHEGALSGLRMPRRPNFSEEDVSDKPRYVRGLPPRHYRGARKFYRAQARTLLAVDDAVRAMVRALKRSGRLDRTVIVFTSDNGFLAGAHRLGGKLSPYEESVNVPFVVRFPGARGRSERGLASNVDLAPTFADLAGARLRRDGRSLVPLLANRERRWRKRVLLEWRGSNRHAESDINVPKFWGLRSLRYKYVEYRTGERELYDLRRDPYELRNRIGSGRYRDVRRRLARQLDRLRRS
jgi:N-acetylglucosamine-6-sulfatase